MKLMFIALVLAVISSSCGGKQVEPLPMQKPISLMEHCEPLPELSKPDAASVLRNHIDAAESYKNVCDRQDALIQWIEEIK